MATVPNQRIIAVHRERAASDFLGIKNEHWQTASCNLGAHALMLYLYFASNANGFMLELSPSAIRREIGMPSSTYRDQFLKLIDKGYLVQRNDSNIYDFYETPQRVAHKSTDNTEDDYDFTGNIMPESSVVINSTSEDIEINKYKIDTINNIGGEKQVSPSPLTEFAF